MNAINILVDNGDIINCMSKRTIKSLHALGEKERSKIRGVVREIKQSLEKKKSKSSVAKVKISKETTASGQSKIAFNIPFSKKIQKSRTKSASNSK